MLIFYTHHIKDYMNSKVVSILKISLQNTRHLGFTRMKSEEKLNTQRTEQLQLLSLEQTWSDVQCLHITLLGILVIQTYFLPYKSINSQIACILYIYIIRIYFSGNIFLQYPYNSVN